MKPIIGIFTHREKTPDSKPDDLVCKIDYCTAISASGGTPLLIPYSSDEAQLRQLLGLCQGLLVPGGIDIHPSLFGQEESPYLEEYDKALDSIELLGMAIARELGLPVLGICRGMQLMNVFAGGSLYQDLPTEYPNVMPHRQTRPASSPTHSVRVEAGTRLFAMLGTDETEVNSFHHQAVRQSAEGFKVSAAAPDGLVEAIEETDGTWLGVQWHPEGIVSTQPCMAGIFRTFIRYAEDSK